MKITELPTAEINRLLRATENSPDPDEYALRILRDELDRRLDLAARQDMQSSDTAEAKEA